LLTNNQTEKILELISEKVNKKIALSEKIKRDKQSPFFVLISVILSARSRDEITEVVLDNLFKEINKPLDLIKISKSKLEKIIKPIGFFRQKAGYLKKTAKILVKKYNGNIPDSFEELIKLPGVGRKTANLVLILSFNKDTICVDTHVHRISNRLGIVNTKNPEQTEFSLKEKLDKRWWKPINRLFVVYGKTICKPLRPKCFECVVKNYCEYYNKHRK